MIRLIRISSTLVTLVSVACGGETTHSQEGLDVGGMVGTGGAIGTGGTTGGSSSGGRSSGTSGGSVGTSCCASDGDCTPLAPLCVAGSCQAAPRPYCWRDADCGNDETCSGVFTCPCGSNCRKLNQAGTCVPSHAGCCAADVDCTSGDECVVGVCKPRPASGACWSLNDCWPQSLGTCEIAPTMCPCGSTCSVADVAGTCVLHRV